MKLFWQTLLFWILLGGCQAEVFNAHGYKWYFDNTLPICTSYEWVQRHSIEVQRICQAQATFHEYVIGCTFVANACLIISMYDEETAKKVYLPGTDWSHWQHEHEGHLKNRWSHP